MWVYCAGRDIEIGPILGHGGEGEIYAVSTEPGTLVKILFPQHRTAERQEKLKELAGTTPAPSPDYHFAWPEELVFDSNGKARQFLGYTMPRIVNGGTLDKFFDRSEAQFKNRTRSFRVGLAIALAELIAELHQHHLQIVVGDIKPQNLLVDAQDRVALIDLDSVQITTLGGRTYPCPVGSSCYTPPELAARKLVSYAQVPRTKEHDHFGLAVLIFQLLCDGWHPFDGCARTTLDERICAGHWPYAPNSSLRPPPEAPPFGALPVKIQELFTRAFLDGHLDPSVRPEAKVWVEALRRHEKALGRAPKAPAQPVPAPPLPVAQPAGRRWLRIGAAACAAVVLVVVIALGVVVRRPGQPPPEPPKVVLLPPKPEGKPIEPPRRPEAEVYWEQVREQEVRWEDDMNNLLKLVEAEQPAELRDPKAAADACLNEEARHGSSWYFEQLVRRCDALEKSLVRVQQTARGLNSLLEQAPAPYRAPIELRSSPTEREFLQAVAWLRRAPRPQPDVAAILQRVILDELALLGEPLREFHERNTCLRRYFHRPEFPAPDPPHPCPSLGETIERAVAFQGDLREKLCKSRARGLCQPSALHLQSEASKLEPRTPERETTH